MNTSEWQLQPPVELPDWFVSAVRQHCSEGTGTYAAQLLWQRKICQPEHIAGFLNSTHYHPTSPFALPDLEAAIARLVQAHHGGERVAIWGDFDADGITATAVLWEGLQPFFERDRLRYIIPNRLTDSHGLSMAGIDALAGWGCTLIVTCDTGSTNPTEIDHARSLGIDVIVTDHHTLPADRPNVVALVNPRSLPPHHPLASLSGVAVAYKLVEALYTRLPTVPPRPLEALLDLVAIGLIADLVELRGDGRYLAQRGILQLQRHQTQVPPPRPGIARLLELCKRAGDRPTDISFGLGPRINAISRIHGDAHFAVELLTSQDGDRCRQLAEATELANTRRKALQREVVQQVKAQLATLDLSTTSVIVLADPQWNVGILGLVAGQIAQEYGRPTILLSVETPASSTAQPLARGSARSIPPIDLYRLVQSQAHLLHRFGGHPYAAGLSLAADTVPLFTAAINRELREQQFTGTLPATAPLVVDLQVTVAELGRSLFQELKLLEPFSIGNPVPRLLIQNCWFETFYNANIKDWRGQTVRYIKTSFELRDDSTPAGFPGVWWEHYRDEIPSGRCDVVVELDHNAYQKRYEIRLIALRALQSDLPITTPVNWLLDWRPKTATSPDVAPPDPPPLCMTECPSSWDEFQAWFRRSLHENRPLAIAYAPPAIEPAPAIWQRLAGLAKYLSRTGAPISRTTLLSKLGIGDRTLQVGFQTLQAHGFEITSSEQGFEFRWPATSLPTPQDSPIAIQHAIQQFLTAIQEEQFRRQYFVTVPFEFIQAMAQKTVRAQMP